MLCALRKNNNLSAFQVLEGTFDFKQTPYCPLGTKTIIHKMPEQSNSWGPCTIDGCYLG